MEEGGPQLPPCTEQAAGETATRKPGIHASRPPQHNTAGTSALCVRFGSLSPSAISEHALMVLPDATGLFYSANRQEPDLGQQPLGVLPFTTENIMTIMRLDIITIGLVAIAALHMVAFFQGIQ